MEFNICKSPVTELNSHDNITQQKKTHQPLHISKVPLEWQNEQLQYLLQITLKNYLRHHSVSHISEVLPVQRQHHIVQIPRKKQFIIFWINFQFRATWQLLDKRINYIHCKYIIPIGERELEREGKKERGTERVYQIKTSILPWFHFQLLILFWFFVFIYSWIFDF